ncbi:Ig-like domain-containing protein, partial [Escherichia coli]|uniref:Ig-like domain-containing protein n=1 Tax=Escherichia coli TaxID=562 RepID=UPI003FA5D667
FNSDGSYSFDASSYDELSVGEKKEISINVIATDDQGSQGTGQLNITVTGTNDAPVAQASAAIVREGSIVSGAVTAEDVDLPTDASLTFTLSEEVKGLTFNQNGTYQFDASNEAYSNLAAGERLTLKIPVTVTDDQGATDTTRLTINIVGTNEGPVANADTATGTEDGGVITIDVLANDRDVDGDTLTITGATVPVEQGTVAIVDG